MSELGPNAFGEPVDPGRVDCYLGLPLPADEGEEGVDGVLVVAPRWLLHPAVPQPAGSLVYELATGHPDRQAGELVFPADLTEELRAWPQERWAALGVDLEQVASAVVGCWRRGDVRGLTFPLEPGEDPRALMRPAMTLARAELRARLERLVARARAALAASHQRPPARRALPVAPHPCSSPPCCAGGRSVTVHRGSRDPPRQHTAERTSHTATRRRTPTRRMPAPQPPGTAQVLTSGTGQHRTVAQSLW